MRGAVMHGPVARIKDLTNGLGAHSVIEAVGTQRSSTWSSDLTAPRSSMARSPLTALHGS